MRFRRPFFGKSAADALLTSTAFFVNTVNEL